MEIPIEFDPEPDWRPLEKVIPPLERPDFMHMGRIGTLQLYKHRHTRRYLNIDSVTGYCYIRAGADYRPEPVGLCLAYAVGTDQEVPWN